MAELMNQLPQVRGTLTANRDLADLTWMRVGGPADVLFQPADVADLAQFLKNIEVEINILHSC